MKQKNTRFERFKAELWCQLGDRADLLADGGIVIQANEFSPARRFTTLQRAIDNFARHMPDDLK